MATVTVSYGALNMTKGFPFAITHTGQVITVSATPSQIHVLLGGGNFANYNGAFQFFGGAILASSTVFSYEHHAASLGYSLGLSSPITVGDYFGFLDSGNAVGLRDFILSGSDSLTGGSHNDVLIAGLGADTVNGGAGNDRLDGGGDVDTLNGGAGDDSFVYDGSADTFVEDSGTASGTDTVLASLSYSLAGVANIENITLTGTAVIDATGNELDNFLVGNSAANHLTGADGNDTLDGGAGNDTLQGDAGNDVYLVRSTDDVVIDSAGVDEVRASINYTLGADIENLTLTGAAVNGTGNAGDNVLTGNGLANLLDGGLGADTMAGGLGSDTYIVDNVADVVNEAGAGVDLVKSSVSYTLSANVENLLFTGSADIDGTGNSLANILTGNGGANVLDGGAGNDRLLGGDGDDTYVVQGTDIIVELANQGDDTVQSAGTYSIALLTNVENLELTGSGNVNATGNLGPNELAGNTGNNLLVGGAGNDTLSGNDGNDTLDGGLGANSLSGGLGNDVFVFHSADDVATEGVGEGIDTVRLAFSAAIPTVVALADNVENLQIAGAGAFSLTGNALDNLLVGNGSANTLSGGLGDDTLDGGAGLDSMSGGDGNDLYVLSMATDIVDETGTDSGDTVRIAYSVAAPTSIDLSTAYGTTIENLQITGAGAFNLFGNTADNVLTGNGSNNLIDGGAGADTMAGSLGADTYIVDNLGDVVNETGAGIDLVKSSVSYTLSANVENLLLTGSADIDGTGNSLANILTGNAGANLLDGGAGIDRLVGGVGDDTYVVDNMRDVVVEASGGGTDLVQSSVSYSIAPLSQVENLELIGGANVNATGNAGPNELTGNTGNNLLLGGAGNDTLSGSDGNDTLDGGLGADHLIGSAGDDLFVFDSLDDVATEGLDEGTDTVRVLYSAAVSPSIDLSDGTFDNIENLVAIGAGSFTLTGNALDNLLVGNASANTLQGGLGDDTLDGGAGLDSLSGGDGNDLYVLSMASDDVSESGAADTSDTVRIAYNVAVPTTIDLSTAYDGTIENLQITGAGAFKLFGNTADNVLAGNGSANLIDGGVGADTMAGGLGADTYIVDNIGDVVNEAGAGVDLVKSSVSYTLSASVENLLLTGSDPINGTGNTLANVLTGNEGQNVLDGGSGIDRLVGGGGDDTYVVDNMRDVVVEASGGGTDLVQSSVSYSIALLSQVENLELIGGANVNATGSAGPNELTGNTGNNLLLGGAGDDTLSGSDGNDTLDGGAGADSLAGGIGDDLFVFDSLTDVATENAAEGTDTVRILYSAAVSALVDLGVPAFANIENLVVVGAGAFTLTGNDLDNSLVGNASANTLSGGIGDDTLDGGAGLDNMSGGTGDDLYVLSMATDIVDETGGDTSDTVRIAYSVAAPTTIDLSSAYGGEIENLQITGAGAFKLTGSAADNVLTGNGSANLIDGGLGADTMAGGLGADTYIVDNLGDVVNETGAGVDLVKSSVSFTLGASVENLLLTGSDPINGTGNTLANVLTGNGANNVLDGGAGIDRLVGGAGDDTYVVDNARDAVIEGAGGGHDLVQSSVTYSIALLSQVEDLELTGGANVNATGNAGPNELTGNTGNNLLLGGAGDDTLSGSDGNDTLDGGTGANSLAGGPGDDLYLLGSESDQVVENPGEGSDTVRILYAPSDSSLDLTTDFGGDVENVEVLPARKVGDFTAAKFFEIIGNVADNRLSANGQVMVLSGGDGNDTLSSGFGDSDNMIGGAGADQFVFDAPYRDPTTNFAYINFNTKIITDFEPGTDRIALDNDFFPRVPLGQLDSEAFASGAGLTQAVDSSDRVIYDTTTGNLYYDFDGSGSTGVAWLFATLSSHPALAASDIEVIN